MPKIIGRFFRNKYEKVIKLKSTASRHQIESVQQRKLSMWL